jgi:hypothetical protein
MKTKILGLVAAFLLFGVDSPARADTYTIDVEYNLLDGTLYPTSFQSYDIPVNLPTLFAGDVIDTTINFTQGLALRINDPGPGRQLFSLVFLPNNSASGEVRAITQTSLRLAHGDLLTPDVVTNLGYCVTCVYGAANQNFTDSSFSFRGFEMLTTILFMPESFGSDRMHFSVDALLAGDIEITHGASPNPVPLPATLPLFATGLGVLGLLGWRRKRKAAATLAAT